jgi:hypothetical protein
MAGTTRIGFRNGSQFLRRAAGGNTGKGESEIQTFRFIETKCSSCPRGLHEF